MDPELIYLTTLPYYFSGVVKYLGEKGGCRGVGANASFLQLCILSITHLITF